MANWLNHYSFVRRAPKLNKPGSVTGSRFTTLLWLALASAGCGRAAAPAIDADHTNTSATTAPAASSVQGKDGIDQSVATALCTPAPAGRLQARLQGAIEAEIDWSAPDHPQCLGGPRPAGNGIRLLFKGEVDGEPLVFVIGIGGAMRGAPARNLPANLTLIREGTGVFYATQGDDKCALDSLEQTALDASDTRFTLTGRGYCTQPARALGGEGVVLVSRFDFAAMVDFPPIEAE